MCDRRNSYLTACGLLALASAAQAQDPVADRDSIDEEVVVLGTREQGYRATVESLELQAAGWTLTLLRSSADRLGLLSMTLATNRQGGANIVPGSRSTIEFDTRSALWRFTIHLM